MAVPSPLTRAENGTSLPFDNYNPGTLDYDNPEVNPERDGSSLPQDRDMVFRRESDYWTLSYDGTVVRLRHLKGFLLIVALLRYPDRRLLAMDLAVSAGEESDPGVTSALADNAPILDYHAKASYRERVEELRESLEEAHSKRQLSAAKIEEELDFLTRELARALGVFGRDGLFASNSERARLRVTNAIRTAIRKILEVHPSLGRHLANTIKTGAFCYYAPESSEAVWRM